MNTIQVEDYEEENCGDYKEMDVCSLSRKNGARKYY